MIETKLPITDKTIIGNLIPQKHPFAMVDYLQSYSETYIEAGITVMPENIFVKEGVFEEPGVIEHMAQSVALHTGYKYYLMEKEAPVGYIGSIKDVTVMRLPLLGEKLLSNVTILQEFMGVTMVKIQTTIDGEVIANAEMKTIIANQDE